MVLIVLTMKMFKDFVKVDDSIESTVYLAVFNLASNFGEFILVLC